MRRALGIVAVLGVGIAVGRLSNQPPVSAECAGAGGDSLPTCQDVNGDGVADITDPVYLLNWLFLGGPDPECEDSPCPSQGLPDTGQSLCYDLGGTEIPCDSETCAGQDGFYATGCPSEERFADNGDGTVTDTCTGFMWQQETAPEMQNWQGALQYCDSLNLAGHDDWRLPNIRELHSIVDYGRFDPAIDPVFAATSYDHWSSTTYAKLMTNGAWDIDFATGHVGAANNKRQYISVRAVRTIQPGE